MTDSRSYMCWRDEDGYHVWQRHTCHHIMRTSKLPSGPQGWGAPGNVVIPSINCLDCGLHLSDIPISEPPFDWSGGPEMIDLDATHKGKST